MSKPYRGNAKVQGGTSLGKNSFKRGEEHLPPWHLPEIKPAHYQLTVR